MWVWLKLKLTPKGNDIETEITVFFVSLFIHSPQRYLNGRNIIVTFRLSTLSETKICNLHPKVRRRAFPSLYMWESPPGACHARFAVFFALPSFCVSLLLCINTPFITIRNIQEMETSKTSS